MCWVYVPGLEVSNLASSSPCPERAASLTWRGKPLPPRTLLREWKAARFIRRLSGLILPLSTLDNGVASWIASLAETRASPTASPEKAKAQTTNAFSSTRLFASSRSAGLIVCSERTSQGMLTGSSPLWSRHWKGWATALRQEYSARPKWGRVIGAIDCSLWRSPATAEAGVTAHDLVTATGEPWTPGQRAYDPDTGRMAQTGLTQQAQIWQTPATDSFRSRGGDRKDEMGPDQQARTWPTPMAGTPAQNGNSAAGNLDFSRQVMATVEKWATPQARDHFPPHSQERITAMKAEGHGMRNLNDEAAAWPTPAARDHKGANSEDHVTTNGTGRMHMDQLPNFVEHTFPSSPQGQTTPAGKPSSDLRRSLNPRFVEWLMGWPIGWTDFEQQEMGLSLWQRLGRGMLSMLVTEPPLQATGQQHAQPSKGLFDA